ncbi:MAG: glycyl-radical enzyme activating protein [Deltaproteobacteria bacterium]|nr:glycyl-radical enzyme activating protein [Deltaproteobacteria bacterium]
MEKRRPLVAEIKRNSLDDGPGIRSVVFFKGCPLCCVWCHNPECTRAGDELMFRAGQCVGCGACAEVCKEDAIAAGGRGAIDRELCTLCGDCTDECPSDALSIVGSYYEPEDLVETLLLDKPFYDNSGGGVTLSGGEPTMAMNYTAAVAKGLRERGVHVLVETCGDFSWKRFADTLLPHVDLVYVDMKIESAELHEKFTGRPNDRIKANLERLASSAAVEFLVRVPLVPEVTATHANLRSIAAWLRERGVDRIALLPYNPLWCAKAQSLGDSPAYDRSTFMSREECDAAKKIFEGFRLERDF